MRSPRRRTVVRQRRSPPEEASPVRAVSAGPSGKMGQSCTPVSTIALCVVEAPAYRSHFDGTARPSLRRGKIRCRVWL